MSCKLDEALKDIEALAAKPGAKSIASSLLKIVTEARALLSDGIEYQKGGSNKYDSALSDKIADKLKTLYSDIEVIYIKGQGKMRGVLEELSGGMVMFQLSNKRKQEFETKLRKARPELDGTGIDSILKSIEKFSETEADGNDKLMKKLELLALHWTLKGNLILPEDGSKVMQALKISEKEKFDPFNYSNPNEIVEKYAHVNIKDKPINPDDYIGKGFSNKQVHGDTVIYDVSNDEIGRTTSRLAIDTHFGVTSNPWCLLAKDSEGSIKDSATYWFNQYPGPKKIVFVNNKLSYFYGDNKFWDRMDTPNDHILAKDFNITKDNTKKQKLAVYLNDPTNIVYKKVVLKELKGNIVPEDDASSITTIDNIVKTANGNVITRKEISYNGKIAFEGTFETLSKDRNKEYPIGKHISYHHNGALSSVEEYDSNYKKVSYNWYTNKGVLTHKEEPIEVPFKGTLRTTYFVTGDLKEKAIVIPRKPTIIMEEYFSKDPKKIPPIRTRFIDTDSNGNITYIEKANHVANSTLKINRNKSQITYTDFKGKVEVESIDPNISNEEIYTISKDILYYQKSENIIKGAAIINQKKILIDIENRSTDTLAHEYAHFYIAGFRDTPIVQEAIRKLGSEEALVQAIGEQVVKQKGEAYDWWKKFSEWIKDLFSSLDRASKEELVKLLTDAFLTNQDLKAQANTKEDIITETALDAIPDEGC